MQINDHLPASNSTVRALLAVSHVAAVAIGLCISMIDRQANPVPDTQQFVSVQAWTEFTKADDARWALIQFDMHEIREQLAHAK